MDARARRLWELYRLTPDAWAKIDTFQNHRCAGCLRLPKKMPLNTDHRHDSGRISGLLCMGCNKALGYLRDNADTLRRLAAYLDNPPAPQALGKETYGLLGQAKRKKKMVYGPVPIQENGQTKRAKGTP